MIRHVTPMPANPSLGQLRALSVQKFPNLVDINEVDVDGVPHLAVYLKDGDTTSPATWRSAVAGWTPTGVTPEAQEQTAQANVEAILPLLKQSMAGLQATIDTPPATPAQFAQKIVQNARVLRRIIRLLVGDLEGTD